MAKDYVIVVNSTSDLSADMAKDLGVEVIPLKYTFDGEKMYTNYLDFREMSAHAFYEEIRSGKQATTIQSNPDDFKVVAEPILKSGKDVLILAFSSGLSGTYNSGRIAVEELREKYPERQIEIVDTLAASLGEGFLDYLCVQEKNKGKSLTEVKEFAEETKNHVVHYFTVFDIMHLKRGGRVSAPAAIFAKLLSIKPILHVDDAGKLISIGKVIGRKKSVEELFKMMENNIIDTKTIFISHGDDLEHAEYLASLIREKYSDVNIAINYIGPVIGAHSGPGTIALFFLGKHK